MKYKAHVFSKTMSDRKPIWQNNVRQEVNMEKQCPTGSQYGKTMSDRKPIWKKQELLQPHTTTRERIKLNNSNKHFEKDL